MKYLIVGGAGFIGSNLVEHCVKRGDEVIVCDNLHTGSEENIQEFENDIIFLKKNCGNLTKKDVGTIDGIFHLGIYSSSPMYKENPRFVGKAVNEFINMLLLAKETNAKMVWSSTSSMYNGNPTPWREDMPIMVKDYYSEARHYMERLATMHYNWYGTKTLAMRFFSAYGPREEAKKQYANLVSQFLWAMKKGESPILYGDGSQRRDFTYVSDIVQGLQKAMDSPIEHDVLNLGSGVSYDLIELVGILNSELGTDISPKHIKNTIKGYVPETLADTKKAKEALGFEAKIPLEEGIKKIVRL
ncbi:MAG: NAD-dependent epimerase/dehydratase family protein [Candidatus Methanofastidiosia archaeon]